MDEIWPIWIIQSTGYLNIKLFFNPNIDICKTICNHSKVRGYPNWIAYLEPLHTPIIITFYPFGFCWHRNNPCLDKARSWELNAIRSETLNCLKGKLWITLKGPIFILQTSKSVIVNQDRPYYTLPTYPTY